MPRANDGIAPAPTQPGERKPGETRAKIIERLIAPSAAAMGFDIVRVLLTGNRRPRLQIMAERADGGGMSVDDCASLSRAVSAILDVEDPMPGAYELEVSSPGIDRPLTRPADFARFAGHMARIEAATAAQNRRRWTGRLLGLDGDRVRLATADGEVTVPFADLAKAKLVLTDELISAAQAGRLPPKQTSPEPED